MAITSPRAALKRAELAGRLGCNLETIRYYEKIGLLPDPARTASGHRLYSNGDQVRLRFILRARSLGFSVEDVRSLLGINDGRPSCAEVSAPCILSAMRRRSAEERGDQSCFSKSSLDIFAPIFFKALACFINVP